MNKRVNLKEIKKNRYHKLFDFFFDDDYNYCGLSNDSKVLYSLLNSRHELSLKNGWIDEEQNVFFIFTREEMSKMLKKSLPTTRKAIKELIDMNLLEEIKKGFNKPNILYLLTPAIDIVKNNFNDMNVKKYSDTKELVNYNEVEQVVLQKNRYILIKEIKEILHDVFNKDITNDEAEVLLKACNGDIQKIRDKIKIMEQSNEIRNPFGWLKKALQYDYKPSEYQAKKMKKNKICNYEGHNWDYEELEALEQEYLIKSLE